MAPGSASKILIVRVVDVNQREVRDFDATVTDTSSSVWSKLKGEFAGGIPTMDSRIIWFDLASARELTIELKTVNYFDYKVVLTRDIAKGTFEVNARSAILSSRIFEPFGVVVELLLVARRIQKAPRKVALSPRQDLTPHMLDNPGGIWLNGSNLFVGLFDGRVNNFPAVLGREIIGDPNVNTWERFLPSTSEIDPNQHDGGTWFEWLEYGDPNGFRMLIAIWVIHRAGARADGKVDFHFFFCPRTDYVDQKLGMRIYDPIELYPYGRKRIKGVIHQPYSELAYNYLSTGGPTRSESDFGLAYQSIASGKSHILVMPLNVLGYTGPLICRQGLNRLAQEITAYVSDNTQNTPNASSGFPTSSIPQRVNRIAISGYSAGVNDTLKLFHCDTIVDLVNAYGSVKTDQQAQDFSRRLASLSASFWQSSLGNFDRSWSEFYSVDGYVGSDATAAFPGEFSQWFAGNPERILRIYATAGRMKNPSELVTSRLASVFPGVVPNHAQRNANASFNASEWHRLDGRATLAWFSESYMNFNAVPHMPTQDAHHTIPRVVISHALAQSKLLQK